MNSAYTLRQVSTKQDIREFHKLTDRLYKDDRNWIKPIFKDIESVFSPATNTLFRTGEAIRWLLLDSEGKIAGRVAAFYNKKISSSQSMPVGSMGFFECINDREAAFVLFDACVEWLKSKNMMAMEGPVNFGERDRWWGLLVDGFTQPNYCMPYNFAYYRELFEEYGFKNYFEQYTYAMPVNDEGLSNVVKEKAKRVFANPDYSFRYMKLREKNQIARNFMIIYNKGWAHFPGVKIISIAYARRLFKSLRPVIDEKLLWFGFYKDEPVCFFLMLPEVNQITKHLNGKMNFTGKLKFFYYRRIARKLSKAYGLIFGIVPDHQRKGVEGALIMSFAKMALSKHFTYKELEFNWIGDFNPSMMHLLDEIGAKICKTHITYRYLFDRNAPFERAPVVNAG